MGMSPLLDSRVNVYRPDLADASLKAFVKADRYVEASMRQCVRGVVPLLVAPHKDARRGSEIRYGEFLDVFEQREDGFAWVQNRSDHYVGYIQSANILNEEIAAFSNRIHALQCFVYPEPDVKSPFYDRLTLGSYVRVAGEKNGFLGLVGGGYIYGQHIAPTDETLVKDYVFTAGRMLGVPYLWGGRTPLGIDCSGLIQLSLEMAGIDCPRDSDLQREAFGKPLDGHWRDIAWERGDIVFFDPGHVGIMTSRDHIIHANAFHMQVTVEPLANVVGRYAKITAMGRPI